MAYQFEFKVLDNISPVLNTLAGSFVKIQQDAQKFNATTTKCLLWNKSKKSKVFRKSCLL